MAEGKIESTTTGRGLQKPADINTRRMAGTASAAEDWPLVKMKPWEEKLVGFVKALTQTKPLLLPKG